MSRVLLVCLVLIAAALQPWSARAGELIFQDFDAAPLNASEKRLLQTALAATDDYRGPLDGDWGAASQAAFAAYAAREFGGAALNAHAAALVLDFLDEVGRDGWDFSYLPELGVSLALPLARLGPPEPEDGGERRWTDDGRLTVLTHRLRHAGSPGLACRIGQGQCERRCARHRAAHRSSRDRGYAGGRKDASIPALTGSTRNGPRSFSRASPTRRAR